MKSTIASISSIIDFWFKDENKKLWFNGNDIFDEKIRQSFELTYNAGVKGELKHWEETAEGSLALVILYDQFPLNMYRDNKKGFATEALSREVAIRAIAHKFDQQLTQEQKSFLYLPFMHSENEADQQQSIDLFLAAGLEGNMRFAKHHQQIIKKFGRFPHRNKSLNRKNTKEEEQYLISDAAFLG